MARKTTKLLFLLCIAVGLVFAYKALGLGQYFTLDYIKSKQAMLEEYYTAYPLLVKSIYFGAYVFVTACSIPAATVLTLIGGALFGFWSGTVLVSFASAIGATCAFFMARFFARDYFKMKFHRQLSPIDAGIEKEGSFYLFALRLVPVFPFFLINITMGLTKMHPVRFFLVSQIGMLPGTIAYVNAGKGLGQIDSVAGILSPEIFIAFALLGIFPLLAKWFLNFLRHRKILKPFKKPKRFDYNLVVIGAGAAGLVSSFIGSTLKAKVALIEKDKMGGDCLNRGCIPSKALIRTTKFLADMRRAGELGLDDITPKINFRKIMERVHRKIKAVAQHDSVERYEGLGVECFQGEAHIASPYKVVVGGKYLTTKNIIIASGGKPIVPDLPGIDDIHFYTSDTIWRIKDLPKRLLILGGGPIGCELGQCFARLGTNVTIVQRANQLLPREDLEIGEILKEQFISEDIKVHLSHEAKAFKVTGRSKKLVCLHQYEYVEIPFDTILLALGRKPNIDHLGLDKIGIEMKDQYKIALDPFMRTNFPNIYVCGDVAGSYQYTHTAAQQAWYASVNALMRPWMRFRVDNRVIPWCTFTGPEVARVGLNEKEAQGQSVAYEVSVYGLSALDRAITDSDASGIIKVLTVPGKDKILGVSIIGSHAGEMITEFILAMKHNIGLNKVLKTIHIYPTYAEANKYAAGAWKKKHAPDWALKWLKRWHVFNRH